MRTGYEVAWTVELEEEELSWLKCPKDAVAARLPEVHLVERRDTGQEVEPVAVRDADKGPHSDSDRGSTRMAT